MRGRLPRGLMVLVLLFGLCALASPARGDRFTGEIDVFINGGYVYMDPVINGTPQIVKGHVMVPLRRLAEALEMKVEWIENPRSVRLRKGTHNIMIPLGLTYGVVDGRQVDMGVAADIFADGHAYIPLRFVAEGLGKIVNWDESDRSVSIDDPPPDMNPGPQVHVQVDGVPAQGNSVVVRAWMTQGEDPTPLSGARMGTLWILYPDGTKVSHTMKWIPDQSVFVGSLALTTDAGYSFKIQAMLRVGAGDVAGTASVKVAPPLQPVDDSTLQEWDQIGRRPQFATSLRDPDLNALLPLELSAQVTPEMPENGTSITVTAHVQDAYLQPVTGLSNNDLSFRLTGPDGRGQSYSLEPKGGGTYAATINIGYPGYATQMTWELRLTHKDRALAVTTGSFFVR